MSKHRTRVVEDIFEDDESLLSFFVYFGWKDLVSMSLVNRRFKMISEADVLWKPLSIKLWNELKHATEVEKDPPPAWKSCFIRKFCEEGTSMFDIMKDREFSHCDWYSCPNGHLYMIGECRLPMIFSRCTECGERIGGRSHQMLRGNQRYGSVNHGISSEESKKIEFEKIEEKVRKNSGSSGNKSSYMGVSVFDYDGGDEDDSTWMNFAGGVDSDDDSSDDGDNDGQGESGDETKGKSDEEDNI